MPVSRLDRLSFRGALDVLFREVFGLYCIVRAFRCRRFEQGFERFRRPFNFVCGPVSGALGLVVIRLGGEREVSQPFLRDPKSRCSNCLRVSFRSARHGGPNPSTRF